MDTSLMGAYSRRINIQNRIVYEVFTKEKTVRVLRMWAHYERAEAQPVLHTDVAR